MSRLNVIALKAFEFRDAQHAEGETFAAAPLDAVQLINRRLVRLDTAHPHEAPKPRRTYRRRDLVADKP